MAAAEEAVVASGQGWRQWGKGKGEGQTCNFALVIHVLALSNFGLQLPSTLSIMANRCTARVVSRIQHWGKVNVGFLFFLISSVYWYR